MRLDAYFRKKEQNKQTKKKFKPVHILYFLLLRKKKQYHQHIIYYIDCILLVVSPLSAAVSVGYKKYAAKAWFTDDLHCLVHIPFLKEAWNLPWLAFHSENATFLVVVLVLALVLRVIKAELLGPGRI